MYFVPDFKDLFRTHNKGVPRHWSSTSEAYTSFESLLTAIDRGCEVYRVVIRSKHWHRQRAVYLYHFELRVNGQHQCMAVVENPAVLKLLRAQPFQIVQYEDVKRVGPTPSIERNWLAQASTG